MVPKGSAEVPSRLPQPEKAVMCLMEKIFMLDKLPAWAVGCEGNTTEAAIYVNSGGFEQTHTHNKATH